MDVARLYRLALEKTDKFARYQAVAEEGVPMRAIAEIVGKGLKVPMRSITPEEGASYFGWMGHLASRDLRASSAKTRRALGWEPKGPGLIEDLGKLEWLSGCDRAALGFGYPGRERPDLCDHRLLHVGLAVRHLQVRARFVRTRR